MMNWLLNATTVALLGTAACASSAPTTSPLETESASGESAPAFTHLAWADVDAAVKAGAVLVDARGAEGFGKGHIAGAINVPAGDDAAFAALPADKATRLIFYCGGPACSASTHAAEKAKALGYTNIAEYKGGYPEWSATHAAQ